MSFTNITFKNTHDVHDDKINDYVTQKLSSLEKYFGAETDAQAEVEFGRVAHHKSGDVCRVEVNIKVAGKFYRAEAEESSFTAAVDTVRDELDHEIRQSSSKRQSRFLAGARKIKEMLRFGA